MKNNRFMQIYKALLKEHGPQGWWPLLELEGNVDKNPSKTGYIKGYHPSDYTYPWTKE